MLQQTTVATVKDYYLRFVKKWPSVQKLANAPLDDVLKLWAGLGYYARARNLHACARVISLEFDGFFPNDSKTLVQLSGIGPYTSAAIAAICFDEKIAVVDGNVERVTARFLALNKPVRDEKQLIGQTIQTLVPKRAGDFAQSMMDLGATICTPTNPKCNDCPLKANCAGFASKNPARFPRKSPKKSRPIRYGHAFVIQRESGETFLQKRGEKGLLAKMTQVPTTPWGSLPEDVQFPLTGAWKHAGEIVHVFTHFRLELTVWHLALSNKSVELEGYWTGSNALADEALPSVFRKVLSKANPEQKMPPGISRRQIT